MKILQRYVFRELILPFLLCMITLNFIFMAGYLVRAAHFIIGRGIPIGDTLYVLMLALPGMVGYTIPTSIFVCEAGGMVVICAGTTGYSATVDLRYHWVRQKRLQGSHGTNDGQALAYNQLVYDGKIDPCLGEVYDFEGIGQAHYDMEEGKVVLGNRVALVGASETGMGRK